MSYVVFTTLKRLILECLGVFFFQAEDGIRDLVRSRGLGDVYKRQGLNMLDRVADDLAEYVSILESDKLEVEAQATMILSLIHI